MGRDDTRADRRPPGPADSLPAGRPGAGDRGAAAGPTYPHTSVTYLVAAYVIFGIGCGLVTAPITNTAVSGMPKEQAGVAGAVASTSRQVGASLGVAVTGSIVADDRSATVVR
jgi:MFS family permease